MSNELVKHEQQPAEVMNPEQTRNGPVFSPRFDIYETDNELTLFGDLPGVCPDHLDIQFENRLLTIHGKVEPRHADINFLYGEYGIGDFYRTFTIGEDIDADKITAELKDGVLTLHLPKTDAVRPRKIQINAG